MKKKKKKDFSVSFLPFSLDEYLNTTCFPGTIRCLFPILFDFRRVAFPYVVSILMHVHYLG